MEKGDEWGCLVSNNAYSASDKLEEAQKQMWRTQEEQMCPSL